MGANGQLGQLHVHIHTKFHVPILLPDVLIDIPPKFQLGLAWEYIHPENPVDLDASLVGLDSNQKIVDTIWYGQLKGLNGGGAHSGDDQTGDGDGDDETITVDLTKLPKSVVNLA